jgi:deazaflavin-dependent oxidoreductase (nitroreductase family)
LGFFTDIWNQFNKVILNTPLHGITSKNTILITFRGRKSGLEYTTPVNYTQHGDTIRITSLAERSWWRNLIKNPDVIITLRGKQLKGTAEVFRARDKVTQELENYLKPVPRMARYFKVKIDPDGKFNEQDLFNAAENRVMIKIHLNSSNF